MLGNAGLPPQAAFVTLPSGRWKRKDAESAPTCRSRVFVRRATAKAGDRYKKRGLCRRRILRCAGSFFALLALPCRRGSFSAPRKLTASAAGCVGHRSPSVSHLRYSRLDASLRSRPLAAANGRLPACVRAARRPVCSGFFPYGAGTARFRFGIGACAAALRPAMPQPTGRPLFAGPARVRSTWARTLASRQARTCGVLYGLRRTKQNRRRLRTAVSSRTARRRARRAGRPERSPIWRLARMRFKRRRCGRGVSPTRAKPVRIPKGKWCASGGASDEISGRYAFSRL